MSIALSRRRHGSRTLAAAFLLIGVTTTAAWTRESRDAPQSQTMIPLRVAAFPGAFNLPLQVAQDCGMFSRSGLAVTIVPVKGSVEQMGLLRSGAAKIAVTAFDNVLAYGRRSHEEEDGRHAPVAIGGSDDGFLRLVAPASVTSYQQLAGQAVAVDAPTTGFAFLLRAMLEKAGVEAKLVGVGGAVERWQSLRNGTVSATLLSSPFDLIAERAHFHVLGRPTEIVGSYEGPVIAADRRWFEANRKVARSFLAARLLAVRWLDDTRNRAAALAALRAHSSDLDESMATKLLTIMRDPQSGFARDGRIDPVGAAAVARLRERFAAERWSQGEIAALVDEREAVAARAAESSMTPVCHLS